MAKRKAAVYPPLLLLQELERQSGDLFGYTALREYLRRQGDPAMNGISEKEFVRFLFDDREFLNPKAQDRYRELNRALLELGPKIFDRTIQERLVNGKAALSAEYRDFLLAPEVFARWGLTKQCYQPDPDFASALLRTEDLQLTRFQLEHLPVADFYVDLSDVSEFDPIVGGMVSVETYPDRASLAVYLLTKTYEYFSFYVGGAYDDHDMIALSFTDPDFIATEPPHEYDVVRPDGSVRQYTNIRMSRVKASMFCMQILCYLSSRQPDITDSPRTASTYRPVAKGMKPKQKWSEVQIHDVGIRYGQMIRLNTEKKEEQKEEKKAEKTRKPPIPHFRRAHWQHFWTGKGRTVCEVLWIAPTFVGRETETSKADLVIHKIQ